MTDLIAKADAYVRELMRHDCTGHDYLHVDRVRTTALAICREESVPPDVGFVELVALLHDVGDAKLPPSGAASPLSAGELVRQWGGGEELGGRVQIAVSEIGFKGGFNAPPSSREAEIVQDADRLDALGAVGIARAFAYGGHAGQKPFDPSVRPQTFANEHEYRRHAGTTVNHFHEKLFRLPDTLHTDAAKRMAERRIGFMRRFLLQLGEECGCSFES